MPNCGKEPSRDGASSVTASCTEPALRYQGVPAVLKEEHERNRFAAAVFNQDSALVGGACGKRNRETSHSAIEQEFLMLASDCKRSGIHLPRSE